MPPLQPPPFNAPLVSVVLTTHNRPAEFQRALRSVLAQSYVAWELFVIDDCSTPSITLPNEIDTSNKILVIRNSNNRHLAYSRNLGVSHSSGKYIAFLDDDDYWHPEKLAIQIAFMQTHLCSASYTRTVFFDINGNLSAKSTQEAEGNIFDLALIGQPTSNMSAYVITRELFAKTSGFDVCIRKGIDGLFIRQISFSTPILLVPHPLTFYCLNTAGGKITSDSRMAIKRALKSYRLTLLRYRSSLNYRPYHRSIIYLKISYSYLLLFKPIPFVKYLLASISSLSSACLPHLRASYHTLSKLRS